jgi:hypothetical protein
MKALDHLYRFFLRFRYPVSLPEDIADALGLPLSNFVTFKEFVRQLLNPSSRPTRLTKFMPRDQAEAAFKSARRIEHFKQKTLFSYYFSEGWMEFVLLFDDQSRLRRVYLQHKQLEQEGGVEIPLNKSLENNNKDLT